MASGAEARRQRDAAVVASLQVVLLAAFAVLARYDSSADPRGGAPHDALGPRYPIFQDVHVMIFVGFGFLMTFLRKYGYSSVSFNMLVGTLTVQWAIIVRGLFELEEDSKIHVSLTSLLSADLATAAVLISMGAVLGKTTPLQLILMSFIEIVIATANEYLGVQIFKAVDAGASMFVHVFGAYFGLAVSLVLGHGARIRKGEGNALEGASYTSDLFAMLGTMFLWMFWPSFNGALVEADAQHRAVINTYLSLASCCAVAFVLSALLSHDNKFDMVHIQNATLAGGVAVGTGADMLLQPWGALAVGAAAGALSVFGYARLQPFLLSRLRLHDTCGVHNLHGMPGLLAGAVGALAAGLASPEAYGGAAALAKAFPARAASAAALAGNATAAAALDGAGRAAGAQAGYQLLALAVTLAVACVGGLVTGFILKLPFLNGVSRDYWFSDEYHWEVPSENHSHKLENGNEQEDTKTETLYDSQLHI
ncbi:hypothetical protein R5R35_012566 [Gryllus longicercus]|uniref:Ammonium transporter AmtB-like domain-containing protein n=1 Tax=Gryllus longicercus TaxID=2509291 RepID=A0AAN9VW56_9ORTH